MKTFVTVLFVLVVFGSARGDGEASTEEPVCPVVHGATGESRPAGFKEFIDRNANCLMPSEDALIRERLKTATPEEKHDLLKGYCDRLPVIIECMAKTRGLAHHCLTSESEYHEFHLHSIFAQYVTELVCIHDGAHLDIFYKYEYPGVNSSHNMMDRCYFHALHAVHVDPHIDHHRSLMKFHLLNKFKECVAGYGEGHDEDVNNFVNVLKEESDKLECIEHGGNHSVPCKTIFDRECPVHNDNHEHQGDFILFSERALECFFKNTEKTNLRQEFSLAHTEADFQSIYTAICETATGVDDCRTEVKILAGICLHGNTLDIFNGHAGLSDAIRDIACVDKGARSSTIMAQIRATVNASDDFSKRCGLRALDGLNPEAVKVSEFKLTQYHLLKAYKNCLADYGREHDKQAVVDSANYLNEGLEKLTCFDKSTGNTVLCNTIDHNFK